MSDQCSDTNNNNFNKSNAAADQFDYNNQQRFVQQFADAVIREPHQYEEINMTFSEAKETDYHNLSEFRKIQMQKQSSNDKLQSPREAMRSKQHVQISAFPNPQSRSALADPKGYSHQQYREKAQKKQIKKKQSHNKSQNSPARHTQTQKAYDSNEFQNQDQIEFKVPNDQLHQKDQKQFEKITNQQINDIINNDSQKIKHQSEAVDDQNMDFMLCNLSSGSLLQSSRAQQMMNNLRTKGQIKLHKGLKKNYQVVTSKQNSQPPSKCSNKVESNNFFNMPKLSVSSSIINVNSKQKQIYKKRSSMGGPPQAKPVAYKVNSNLSIGQIIAGPLQIKVKRKSLASNQGPIASINAVKGKKPSSSKNHSPIRPQQQFAAQQLIKQLPINQQQYLNVQNLSDQSMVNQIISKDVLMGELDKNSNLANSSLLQNQNLTNNKKIIQGAHQYINKPNASFKKIRKQSHIKHNSIDRAHMMNVSQNKQKEKLNFKNLLPNQKETKQNYLSDEDKIDQMPPEYKGSQNKANNNKEQNEKNIKGGEHATKQRSQQRKSQNQAPHTTKNLQGMGVLKKLIQQQNPEQFSNNEQLDLKFKLTEHLKEQSSWNSVKKIMRSFDENQKKKSLSGNHKSNQNVTVLVNVQKQVKNIKNQKKIKSMSINQQLDDLHSNHAQQIMQDPSNKDQSILIDQQSMNFQNTDKQLQMKSFHVNDRIDVQNSKNQNSVIELDETSPVNSRNVIYATQDHCNAKIIKKDQQKAIMKNMKKLNQNLLNVISPVAGQSSQFIIANKSQGASFIKGEPQSEPRKVCSANLSQKQVSQKNGLPSQPSNPSGSYGPQIASGGNSGCGTGGSNPNTGGTNNQLSQNNISSSAGVSASKQTTQSHKHKSISGSQSIYKSFDQNRINNQQQQKNQLMALNFLGADLVGSYSMSRKSAIEDDIDLKSSNQFGTLGMKSSSHQLEGIQLGKGAKLTKEQMKQSILLNQQVHHLNQQNLMASVQQQQPNISHQQSKPQNQTKNQNKLKKCITNNSGSNKDTNGNGKKQSQPSEGLDQLAQVQQQLSYGKSAISSQKSKKNNKGGMFQMFSTEDNRSSFTGILKGQKSKISSGNGGHLNSGSGSGNHYATMNTGLQNKTTSSKNTNTFRKTRRRCEANGQSGDQNNILKKGNFLDEFSQFEEQFEKNQHRQKVYVNEQRITNTNEVQQQANKRTNIKEKRLQALLGDQLDPKFYAKLISANQPPNQDDQNSITNNNNKKLNTSFINSISSDRLLAPNLSNMIGNQNPPTDLQQQQVPNLQNQNKISDQYDSYMRDFQMVTNKLLAQKKIIDSQRNCEQCNIYQQLYQRNQMQKLMTETKQQSNAGYQMNQLVNYSLNDDGQYIGTYQGHEFQHIQHNLMTQPQGPGQGQPLACYCPVHQQQILMLENQNQIVSQSRVIIPRGIVNFKKVHSLSTERRNNSLNLVGNIHSLNPRQNQQHSRPNNQQLNLHNYSQSQPPRQVSTVHNQFESSTIDPRFHGGPQNQERSQESYNGNSDQRQIGLRESSFQNAGGFNMAGQSCVVATGGTGDAGGDNYSSNQDENELQREQVNNDRQQNPLKMNMVSSVQSQESANNNTFWQSQGTFNQPMGSFLLEPRDQSLMRKKKVIEILKTFQEQEEGDTALDKRGSQNDSKGPFKDGSNNFGEDMNNVQRMNQHKKKQPFTPLVQSFVKDPKNHTYQVDKPIIIKQQNRVKKQNLKGVRRRDQVIVDKKTGAIASGEDLNDASNLMSDLNEFIMCEDQKINQQEEKFMQQSRKNQEILLNQMLNEDYSDADNPFDGGPSTIHPVLMGSFADEDEKNDEDAEEQDDFKLKQDLGIIDNVAQGNDIPQDLASNCQVKDLIGSGLIQSNLNSQKVVSPRDFLSSQPQQKFQMYPMATSSEYPSGSPPHFFEEGQQASTHNLQLQTQIKNIDSIFEVENNTQNVGIGLDGSAVHQLLSPHIIQNKNKAIIRKEPSYPK